MYTTYSGIFYCDKKAEKIENIKDGMWLIHYFRLLDNKCGTTKDSQEIRYFTSLIYYHFSMFHFYISNSLWL